MLKNPSLSARVQNCVFTLTFLLSWFCAATIAQTVTSTPPSVPKEANAIQGTDSSSRPSDALTNNPPPPSESVVETNYLSSKEFIIAILITIVALIALSMQFFLLRNIPKLRAEDSLRSFGVILILMGTLFVIAAGFDSIQIAPAMGLFGTVAGYLLGRVEKREEEKHD